MLTTVLADSQSIAQTIIGVGLIILFAAMALIVLAFVLAPLSFIYEELGGAAIIFAVGFFIAGLIAAASQPSLQVAAMWGAGVGFVLVYIAGAMEMYG